MSPADELAQYLEDENVGEYGGEGDWSIFIASEPTEPGECITLFDRGPSEEYFQPIDLSSPGITVRTRSFSYEMAYQKQEDIKAILTTIANQYIGRSYYIGVWCDSDVTPTGRDSNERFLLTCTYRVMRQSNPGAT